MMMTVLERDRAIAHAWRTGDAEGYLRLTEGKLPAPPKAVKVKAKRKTFGRRKS